MTCRTQAIGTKHPHVAQVLCADGRHVVPSYKMMWWSKGILTTDTYGLLRTLCSRNPKTFEIRPVRATFSCFAGPKVMLFHASMKRMTF